MGERILTEDVTDSLGNALVQRVGRHDREARQRAGAPRLRRVPHEVVGQAHDGRRRSMRNLQTRHGRARHAQLARQGLPPHEVGLRDDLLVQVADDRHAGARTDRGQDGGQLDGAKVLRLVDEHVFVDTHRVVVRLVRQAAVLELHEPKQDRQILEGHAGAGLLEGGLVANQVVDLLRGRMRQVLGEKVAVGQQTQQLLLVLRHFLNALAKDRVDLIQPRLRGPRCRVPLPQSGAAHQDQAPREGPRRVAESPQPSPREVVRRQLVAEPLVNARRLEGHKRLDNLEDPELLLQGDGVGPTGQVARVGDDGAAVAALHLGQGPAVERVQPDAPKTHAVDGVAHELLERLVEHHDEDAARGHRGRIGRVARVGQPRDAVQAHARLARAGAPLDDERLGPVGGDEAILGGGEEAEDVVQAAVRDARRGGPTLLDKAALGRHDVELACVELEVHLLEAARLGDDLRAALHRGLLAGEWRGHHERVADAQFVEGLADGVAPIDDALGRAGRAADEVLAVAVGAVHDDSPEPRRVGAQAGALPPELLVEHQGEGLKLSQIHPCLPFSSARSHP